MRREMGNNAHIPPGREHLWRRQEESDAELARLDAALKAAEAHAAELAEALHPDDSIVEDADREVERLHDAYNRAVAVNDRIYAERIAGLTSWIDHDPTAPVCTTCGGTGGPPGHDAHGACPTCRGWGREDRPPIPVWSEKDKQWIDPTTGRPVDLLAEKPPAQPSTTPKPSSTTTTPSGAAMTSAVSYGSLRGFVLQLADNVLQQQGPLQQVISGLEGEIAAAMVANEDSEALSATVQTLMQAKALCEEALGLLGQANGQATDAAAGLQ